MTITVLPDADWYALSTCCWNPPGGLLSSYGIEVGDHTGAQVTLTIESEVGS